jgi:proteasome lid subunit RPN8/RPN11
VPRDPEAWLTEVAPRLVELAERDPGREVCGLVVTLPSSGAEAWPLPNRAAHPGRAFRLGPAEVLAALRRLEAEGRALLAVYHSHPAGGPDLSARDLAEAVVDGKPLLQGVLQVVIALDGGRATRVRAHRWTGQRYEAIDHWPAVP